MCRVGVFPRGEARSAAELPPGQDRTGPQGPPYGTEREATSGKLEPRDGKSGPPQTAQITWGSH